MGYAADGQCHVSFVAGLLLLAQPDNVSMIKMVPLSTGETRIEEVILVEPPQDGGDQWSEAELKVHETNHKLLNVILLRIGA